MNAYDLAPLFRSGVGFDRLARLAESASRMAEPSTSYPPYNIERLSAPEDQGERGDAYATKSAPTSKRTPVSCTGVSPCVTSCAASSWPTTSPSPVPT
jgi:hypothetical protein